MFRIAKLITVALVCCSQPALADMVITDDMAPYEICALCHSLDGNSRMSKFPKLAGQPQAYIEKQIGDFIAGRRSNDGGQMVSIVTEIKASDIPVIADWYASQDAPAPFEINLDVSDGRAAFSDLGCAECHDRQNGDGPTPHLTAQHAAYLQKQMTDFRDGRRDNDTDAAMRGAMTDVTDAQIDAIASYLASTPRITK